MTMPTFTGLAAFPPTPIDPDGIVDTAALGILVDRLGTAEVDSIGLLGSTGIYPYLDRSQRGRAVAAAVEAAAGRVPLIVGVGALRTDWAMALAREAERAGTDGLLLAPQSYLPLTVEEAAGLYRTIATATALPVCVYNNPTTTGFAFPESLIADLSELPGIAAIKMPLPTEGDVAGELAGLRDATRPGFKIGYSGDWGAATALLAGADAWYSVVAGLLPLPALRLTRAAQAGRRQETEAIASALDPLWRLFQAHGSLRVIYEVADRLGLSIGDPPLPIRRARGIEEAVDAALAALAAA